MDYRAGACEWTGRLRTHSRCRHNLDEYAPATVGEVGIRGQGLLEYRDLGESARFFRLICKCGFIEEDANRSGVDRVLSTAIPTNAIQV